MPGDQRPDPDQGSNPITTSRDFLLGQLVEGMENIKSTAAEAKDGLAGVKADVSDIKTIGRTLQWGCGILLAVITLLIGLAAFLLKLLLASG